MSLSSTAVAALRQELDEDALSGRSRSTHSKTKSQLAAEEAAKQLAADLEDQEAEEAIAIMQAERERTIAKRRRALSRLRHMELMDAASEDAPMPEGSSLPGKRASPAGAKVGRD